MSDSIAERQAERKRREQEPRDWQTYRQALIDSGMVDEARERWQAYVREHQALFGCDAVRCGASPRPDAEWGYGKDPTMQTLTDMCDVKIEAARLSWRDKLYRSVFGEPIDYSDDRLP